MFADITTNLYEMPSDQYKTLLNNITKTCCKADSNVKRNIDKEAKNFSKELNLEDLRGQDGMLRLEANIHYLKRPQRKL